jgi:DnaJ-class molecular chaperone
MAKKKSVFSSDYSPYGTYEGPRGSKAEWKDYFNETWTHTTAQEAIQEETPWDIIGVKIGSSATEIKTAFRKKMLVHHPDQGGDPVVARKILAAYYLLHKE